MANETTRIIGLDPGLRRTGWGVISAEGSRLRWIAHGVVTPPETAPFAERLLHLLDAVTALSGDYRCAEAPVAEVFVTVTPSPTPNLSVEDGFTLTNTSSTSASSHP